MRDRPRYSHHRRGCPILDPARDPFADMLYAGTQDSDHEIIDAVGAIAENRGVSRAQIALAWLRTNPVVVAPLVGASTPAQIDDAIASLSVELGDDEIADLERPYTPRYDLQGISDDAEMQRIMARIPQFTPA